MRALDRVDDLLHARALREVPLVRFATVGDLLGEVVYEVRVEERAPGFTLLVADREVRRGHLDRDEFDGLGRRAPEDLAFPELLDEAADERAFRAVHARLDAGVVADRHVRGLHGADRAVRVLAGGN